MLTPLSLLFLAVCSTTDPDYDGWISNVASATPYYKDLYVFDITNAAAYVQGTGETRESPGKENSNIFPIIEH